MDDFSDAHMYAKSGFVHHQMSSLHSPETVIQERCIEIQEETITSLAFVYTFELVHNLVTAFVLPTYVLHNVHTHFFPPRNSEDKLRTAFTKLCILPSRLTTTFAGGRMVKRLDLNTLNR